MCFGRFLMYYYLSYIPYAECPRSSYIFYIVSYYITSWTHSIRRTEYFFFSSKAPLLIIYDRMPFSTPNFELLFKLNLMNHLLRFYVFIPFIGMKRDRTLFYHYTSLFRGFTLLKADGYL